MARLSNLISGGVYGLFAVSIALGQTNDGDLQRLRQLEREQQLRQQQERGPQINLQPPSEIAKTIPQGETPCFVIQSVILESHLGPLSADFDWINEAFKSIEADVIDTCLGTQGIAWVIESLQNLLIKRGFVTSRALAKEQDLSRGALTLTIVPGRINEISLVSSAEHKVNLINAMPMKSGDMLNLRDIEQGLENLKRVPTAEADIRIEPSKSTNAQLGDSDLWVEYKQKLPLRLTVTADDSGTKSTGKYLGSLSVALNSPLSISDLLYFTHSYDMGGGESGSRGTKGNTLHYSFPMGYWTFGMASSSNRYHQTVAGLSQSYVYSGLSENNEIKLSRVVFRDASNKASLSLRGFQRKTKNFIDDTEVEVQRRVVGGWEGGVQIRNSLADATIESNISYRKGTGDFGGLPAPEEAFNEGTAKFDLIAADSQLTVHIKTSPYRMRYTSTWRLQNNRTLLTPQDRFAIGGRYSVRGYDGEAVLSAERGWLTRNDLSISLGDSGSEFYMGIDHGEVNGPTADLLVGKTLTGSVLGLRGTKSHFGFDVFYATPVTKPAQFKTAVHNFGFSFSANF